MRRLFLDTAVLAYAVGGEHAERETCRALLVAAVDGTLELHVSAEAVQEFGFDRLRRTSRATALEETRHVLALCTVHPLDATVLDRSLDLMAVTDLRGRDAVHAATALVAGFDAIVTPDRDFDAVPGLGRLDPRDALSRRSPGLKRPARPTFPARRPRPC